MFHFVIDDLFRKFSYQREVICRKIRQSISIDVITVNVTFFNCKRFPMVTVVFREKIMKAKKRKSTKARERKRSKQRLTHIVMY